VTASGRRGSFARWWRRRGWLTRAAAVVLAIYIVLAFLGTTLAPYSTTDIDTASILQPPSWAHPFGSDNYGRDVLSRVLSGTGTIIGLSLAATLLGVGAGTFVGLASGYIGGRGDEIIMRLMDVVMALPALLLALLILTSLGPSEVNLILGIGVTFVPKSARVARSATLAVRSQAFIDVARIRGQNPISILFLEILPNVREVVLVEFCMRFGYSILLIASLGFIGLGVQPPTPDWGLMIYEGRDFITFAPLLVAFPAAAIGFLVVSVHLLADELGRGRARSAKDIGLCACRRSWRSAPSRWATRPSAALCARSTTSASASSQARRWASWASPAPGSPRSRTPCSAIWRRMACTSAAACSIAASASWTWRRRACALCVARPWQWCTRIRSPASTQPSRSAGRSPRCWSRTERLGGEAPGNVPSRSWQR
jgi:peptide/nickel transport system permease protein